ncbi:hypothetical protein HN51_058443 [Arachis hypogaea]
MSSLLLLELLSLSSWGYGFMVKYNTYLRKQRAPKVEVGTRSTDASMDEWLEETAYAQSNANKSKKKK